MGVAQRQRAQGGGEGQGRPPGNGGAPGDERAGLSSDSGGQRLRPAAGGARPRRRGGGRRDGGKGESKLKSHCYGCCLLSIVTKYP